MISDISLSGQSVFSRELAGPREAPDLLKAGKAYVDIMDLDDRVSAYDIDDNEWIADYHAMMRRRHLLDQDQYDDNISMEAI
jgi:hypothetical protein